MARCTVARLMRAMGLAGAVRGRAWVTTTHAGEGGRPVDLVDRRFVATRPNQLWVSDFTYVATWGGFVYVAFVIDVLRRPLEPGQYLSMRYTDRLVDAGIAPSVGSQGDAYDNALAESVIGLYKTEVIRRKGPWCTLEAVEFATLTWVDWFNTRRLLGPLGDIPPAEFEAQYYEQAAVALLGRTETRSLSLTARISLGFSVTNACVRPEAAMNSTAMASGPHTSTTVPRSPRLSA